VPAPAPFRDRFEAKAEAGEGAEEGDEEDGKDDEAEGSKGAAKALRGGASTTAAAGNATAEGADAAAPIKDVADAPVKDAAARAARRLAAAEAAADPAAPTRFRELVGRPEPEEKISGAETETADQGMPPPSKPRRPICDRENKRSSSVTSFGPSKGDDEDNDQKLVAPTPPLTILASRARSTA
jgi:hypothetical protein